MTSQKQGQTVIININDTDDAKAGAVSISTTHQPSSRGESPPPRKKLCHDQDTVVTMVNEVKGNHDNIGASARNRPEMSSPEKSQVGSVNLNKTKKKSNHKQIKIETPRMNFFVAIQVSGLEVITLI